jgi:uncharacterized membrane protein YgdD (TMEM256/DUF423 family)
MNTWLLIASINGFLAVAAGAFGAHALQSQLDLPALQTFETGARYHMVHALAMGLAAFAIRGEAARAARISVALFFAGIVLFSGSLYILATTRLRSIGIVTPFGGLAFLAGWAMLGYAALKLGRSA